MVSKCCGGGFAVTASYANDLAVSFIAVREFYFTDDRYPLLPDRFYQVVLFWYARTLHHFVGIQDLTLTVHACFVIDRVLLQFFYVFLFYCAGVGNKHIVSFLFAENGCANSAFAGSQ